MRRCFDELVKLSYFEAISDWLGELIGYRLKIMPVCNSFWYSQGFESLLYLKLWGKIYIFIYFICIQQRLCTMDNKH